MYNVYGVPLCLECQYLVYIYFISFLAKGILAFNCQNRDYKLVASNLFLSDQWLSRVSRSRGLFFSKSNGFLSDSAVVRLAVYVTEIY